MDRKAARSAEMAEKADSPYVIGLDIGTTSLCAVAADARDGSIARTLVRPNRAALPAPSPDERTQDPDAIVEELRGMLEELGQMRAGAAAIGISSQMHGILYVDAAGKAVSPLYTWQDARGDRPLPAASGEGAANGAMNDGQKTEADGAAIDKQGSAVAGTTLGELASGEEAAAGAATYRQRFEVLTGYVVPSGYGLLTHDVLRRTGGVPPTAAKLCTIGDYAAMRLAGAAAPLMDATQAASLGLFDLRSRSFDPSAAERAGIDTALLPALAASSGALVGMTTEGLSVAVAIGDNQASYLGAVPALAGSLLLNVGTGAVQGPQPLPAQASRATSARPFPDGGWLLSGASLGGGKTYALLAAFYREIAETLGVPLAEEQLLKRDNALEGGAGAPVRDIRPTVPADRLYAAMNRWALAALDEGRPLPKVDPTFFGTRADPERTASITGLDAGGLTPQALTAGLLAGVADELAAFAAQLPPGLLAGVRTRIGAGNGIRRNPALRRLLAERIGAPLELAEEREEAAFGAAVHAAVCAGIFTDYDEALARMGGAR